MVEASTAGPSGSPEPIVSTRLYRLLGEYREQPFTLVRPGGNQGDELIYLGMQRLVAQLHLDHEEVPHDEFMATDCDPGRIVYIHGGGGFAPWWSGKVVSALRKAAATHPGTIIVGPTTFYGDIGYLRPLFSSIFDGAVARRIHLFARERVSHAILRNVVGNRTEVDLDHDTALNLQRHDLLARLSNSARGDTRRYVLSALRQDAERIDIGATDLSSFPIDPVAYCWGFADWLALHAGASRLVTDRLHSAIAGSLLGIPTTLLPNSYHKNRAAWEMSLRERGVEWKDRLPESRKARSFAAVGLRRLLVRHRLLQRAFGRLYFGRLEIPRET